MDGINAQLKNLALRVEMVQSEMEGASLDLQYAELNPKGDEEERCNVGVKTGNILQKMKSFLSTHVCRNGYALL